MKLQVREEIETLSKLSARALKLRYRKLFGEDPGTSNRTRVFRRLAWRLQARAEGELSERARKRAAELASGTDVREHPPASFLEQLKIDAAAGAGRDPRLPVAGSELTREYQGRSIRVRVLERGFEYEGVHFKSLSAVAARVTGVRWNGFCFFGLDNKQVSR